MGPLFNLPKKDLECWSTGVLEYWISETQSFVKIRSTKSQIRNKSKIRMFEIQNKEDRKVRNPRKTYKENRLSLKHEIKKTPFDKLRTSEKGIFLFLPQLQI
jgi:hypothetical protein